MYRRICKNGEGEEKFRVHRLVATAFIPNPDNLLVVNHRDENPSNNCVDNLEWCDAKYNVNYGTRNERAGKKISEKIKGDKNPMYGRTGDKHPTYGKPKSEEHKQKISEAQKGSKNHKAKKVICLETKQVFGCIKDAEDWCDKGNIGKCCKGKTKSAGGYHWQFLDDYLREQRLKSDIKNSRLAA